MGDSVNLKTVFIPEKNEDGSDRIGNLSALNSVGKKYGIKVNYTENEEGVVGYKFGIPENIEFDELSFAKESQELVEKAMEAGRRK